MMLYSHMLSPKVVTKQEILWFVLQLFDPLGYMLPVAIKSRIFLQDIWRTQLGWDDILPIEFVNMRMPI